MNVIDGSGGEFRPCCSAESPLKVPGFQIIDLEVGLEAGDGLGFQLFDLQQSMVANGVIVDFSNLLSR